MTSADADRAERALQAYLDGELSPEETRAFERLLETDEKLARRVEAMRRTALWLQSTRPVPPNTIIETIGRVLRKEAETSRVPERAAPGATRNRPWWRRPPLPRLPRWGWATVGAAALLLVLWLTANRDQVSRDEGLSSGEITPSENQAATAALIEHEFVFDAGNAKEICLVGGFNHWTVCSIPLQRSADGLWRVSCRLPAGRHEYMFVVDGDWQTDPNAKLHVDDGFGNQNAVLLL